MGLRATDRRRQWRIMRRIIVEENWLRPITEAIVYFPPFLIRNVSEIKYRAHFCVKTIWFSLSLSLPLRTASRLFIPEQHYIQMLCSNNYYFRLIIHSSHLHLFTYFRWALHPCRFVSSRSSTEFHFNNWHSLATWFFCWFVHFPVICFSFSILLSLPPTSTPPPNCGR